MEKQIFIKVLKYRSFSSSGKSQIPIFRERRRMRSNKKE